MNMILSQKEDWQDGGKYSRWRQKVMMNLSCFKKNCLMGKSIETENRLVTTKGSECEWWMQCFFLGCGKCSGINSSDSCTTLGLY